MVNLFEVVEKEIDDKQYYLSPAPIQECYIHCIDGVTFMPILSCKDKVIRILDTEKNAILYDFKLPDICNCIEPLEDISIVETKKKKMLSRNLVFGLDNGNVIFFFNWSKVFAFEITDTTPNLLWTLISEENTKSVS